MPLNLSIPRTMTKLGLQYLDRIAAAQRPGAVIVEVGPLYGSSTWTLARSAPEGCTVYSIDTWERAPWIIKNVEEKLGAPPFSKDAFMAFVADCPNVVPIQGYAPDVVSDWDKPIDVYFDDAAHGNPGFINNLSFFGKFVKPGGILCGDDYAQGSPDIVREVDALGASWGVRPEVMGRVWALRKPLDGQTRSTTVSEVLAPLPGPQITVTARCVGADPHLAPPLCWAGQLQKPGPLQAFRLDWVNRPAGLEVFARCIGADRRQDEGVPSGTWARADEAESPILGLALELRGENADAWRLTYQIGVIRDGTAPFRERVNSPMAKAGSWVYAPNTGTPISALRVELSPA